MRRGWAKRGNKNGKKEKEKDISPIIHKDLNKALGRLQG